MPFLPADGLSVVEAAFGIARVEACMPPAVPVPKPGPCPGSKRGVKKAAAAVKKAVAPKRAKAKGAGAYTGPRITIPAGKQAIFERIRDFWADPHASMSTPGAAAQLDEAMRAAGVDRESDVYQRAIGEGTVGNMARAFRERLAPQMSQAEFERAALDGVKDAFSGDIAIRVTPQNLGKVLSSGRFKTQFETGKAKGYFNPEMRAQVERVHGIPADGFPAAKRPVYGYVMRSERPAGAIDDDGLSGYGTIQVVLKPQVRSRTTANVGDSIGNGGHTLASPVDDPSWMSFAFPASYATRNVALQTMDRDWDGPEFRRRNYVEAQIHAGDGDAAVSVDDIAKVIFPEPPAAQMQARLAKAGIPWTVLEAS